MGEERLTAENRLNGRYKPTIDDGQSLVARGGAGSWGGGFNDDSLFMSPEEWGLDLGLVSYISCCTGPTSDATTTTQIKKYVGISSHERVQPPFKPQFG